MEDKFYKERWGDGRKKTGMRPQPESRELGQGQEEGAVTTVRKQVTDRPRGAGHQGFYPSLSFQQKGSVVLSSIVICHTLNTS